MLEMQRVDSICGGARRVRRDRRLVTFDDLLNDLVGELFEPLPAPAAAAPAAATTRIVEIEGNTPVTTLAEMLGVSLGAGAQTVAAC